MDPTPVWLGIFYSVFAFPVRELSRGHENSIGWSTTEPEQHR